MASLVLALPACAPRATPAELALLAAAEGSAGAAAAEIRAGTLCVCEADAAVAAHLDEVARATREVRRSLAQERPGWTDYLRGAWGALTGGG